MKSIRHQQGAVSALTAIFTGPHPTQDRRRAYSCVLQQELMIAPKLNSEITPHNAGLAASIHYAAMAIKSGYVNTVLCVAGESFLSGAGEKVGGNAFAEGDIWFDLPYGIYNPSLYALIAQRYIHEYGIRPEQAAKFAVENRNWALTHPKAASYKAGPLSIDQVLDSPMYASPKPTIAAVPFKLLSPIAMHLQPAVICIYF